MTLQPTLQEGRNADRFREMYMKQQKVKVPIVYWDRTSTKVLTTEWISGVKLTEFESIRAYGYNVLTLVDVGIQCTLRQLLDSGFFHAGMYIILSHTTSVIPFRSRPSSRLAQVLVALLSTNLLRMCTDCVSYQILILATCWQQRMANWHI